MLGTRKYIQKVEDKMAEECRAKNPNLCRVHGAGGTPLEQLNAVAEAAASSQDMDLYMSAREQMDALKGTDGTKSSKSGNKGSKVKKSPAQSRREKLLAKAEEFASSPADSVEGEARYILLELAGDSEEDMFSEAGTDDMLADLGREEGSVEATAAALVYKLLK